MVGLNDSWRSLSALIILSAHIRKELDLISALTIWLLIWDTYWQLSCIFGSVLELEIPLLCSPSPALSFAVFKKLLQSYAESWWTKEVWAKLSLRISVKPQSRCGFRHATLWSLNPEQYGLWILTPRALKELSKSRTYLQIRCRCLHENWIFPLCQQRSSQHS